MKKEVKYAILIVVLALGSTLGVILYAVHAERSGFRGDAAGKPVSGLPTLMEFGAPWCGGCRMMVPVIRRLKQESPGRLNVIVVDVDEHPDTAKSYGFRAIPALVLLSSSGEQLWRYEGALGDEELRARLKEVGVALGP